MRAVNPAFIPRNHLVEEAINAALAGNLIPFDNLLTVLSTPYDDQPLSRVMRIRRGQTRSCIKPSAAADT